MNAKKSDSTRKSVWLDATASHPVIEDKARHLDSFLAAMADGKIEASEVEAQEKRLTGLMKEVEPLLDDSQHEKVTQLLCELTAFNLMQVMHSLHEARGTAASRWRA